MEERSGLKAWELEKEQLFISHYLNRIKKKFKYDINNKGIKVIRREGRKG